jgi:hypothetical protein
MIRLNKILNEGTLNEDPNMNKKVKALLDKGLKDLSKGRPNHQFAVMHVLKGALTDANFHSEAKKVEKLFPRAEYQGDPMAEKDLISIYEEMGEDVASICKWAGEDIVKAIGFYVSMTIGRPMGEKIEKLIETAVKGGDSLAVNEDGPCWKGYEQIGMKTKNGKEVPNCVPKNESVKLTDNLPFQLGKVYSNPYATSFSPLKEEEDHEVSMAQKSLDSIIKHATELKQKLGEMEKNIPGWIQDHITNSENYIEQANSGYHELTENRLKENSYPVYHSSFTHAAEAAMDYAGKKGFEIDENDWQSQVALGGRYGRSRPGVGKTHSFQIGLLKNGKPQRKSLNFQVYGMESGKYELNAYIN